MVLEETGEMPQLKESDGQTINEIDAQLTTSEKSKKIRDLDRRAVWFNMWTEEVPRGRKKCWAAELPQLWWLQLRLEAIKRREFKQATCANNSGNWEEGRRKEGELGRMRNHYICKYIFCFYEIDSWRWKRRWFIPWFLGNFFYLLYMFTTSTWSDNYRTERRRV